MDDDFPFDEGVGFVSTSGGGGSFGGGDDSFQLAQLGGLGGLVSGAARSGGGSLVGGFSRSAGRMAGRVGSIVTRAGQRISTTKAWEIAKRYGPDVAAAAVGMGLADFLAVMMDSGAMTRRRRRRGISSRDVRTTRRVCRFVHTIQHQLAGCAPRARHRRA